MSGRVIHAPVGCWEHLLPFFVSCSTWYCVGVDLGQLPTIALPLDAILLPPHRPPQGTQISSLLQAFDRGLISPCQAKMPSGKPSQDQPDDSGYRTQQDNVDRHQRFGELPIIHDLLPQPSSGDPKAQPAEYGSVDQKEQEGLVVLHSHACS